ncbi:MAG: DNA repair protein RecN [Magnetococcales bacterium]|nr:DNA repair protein RecN [Magnetococcales bacterium]
MLTRLSIEHIALIDRLELEPQEGLTLITGETGAGKSILLDALQLALGERADASLLRSGAEKGAVSALFRLKPDHPLRPWLAERELSGDGDEVHLRRVIARSGRSQSFINDTPVTLAALAQAGELLVDIHGQNAHQTLLQPENVLPLLDGFAGHETLLRETAACHARWKEVRQRLDALRGQARSAAEQRSFLAWQLEELDRAGVRVGEWEELEGRRLRLKHAVKLEELCHRAGDLLLEEGQASPLAGRAAALLDQAKGLDPGLEELAATLRSLHYELADAGERLFHYLKGLESDPESLEELEERLELIRGLTRKHRCEADQLPELATRWRQELAALDQAEALESQLSAELAQTRAAWGEEASRLNLSRNQAADRLSKAVEKELKALRMAGTRFALRLSPRGGDPRADGGDDGEFYLSANPGEPLKPLRQVASGGERSRVMLALKTLLAHLGPVSTLIFDEVDVGVGGRTASAIGARLARLAESRQVLTISHQPQTAAWGRHHWKVEKITVGDQTQVALRPLNPAERVEELARMLAGESVTDAARRNARELLRAVAAPRSDGED